MYVQLMIPPRPPLTVVKLSDHFGQYVLTLKCECGYSRTTLPVLDDLERANCPLTGTIGHWACGWCPLSTSIFSVT